MPKLNQMALSNLYVALDEMVEHFGPGSFKLPDADILRRARTALDMANPGAHGPIQDAAVARLKHLIDYYFDKPHLAAHVARVVVHDPAFLDAMRSIEESGD